MSTSLAIVTILPTFNGPRARSPRRGSSQRRTPSLPSHTEPSEGRRKQKGPYGADMWITPDGRVNTNAHANPADCVSESMMASLTTIAEREGESSIEVIDDGREDFYGLIDNDEIEVTSVTPALMTSGYPTSILMALSPPPPKYATTLTPSRSTGGSRRTTLLSTCSKN